MGEINEKIRRSKSRLDGVREGRGRCVSCNIWGRMWWKRVIGEGTADAWRASGKSCVGPTCYRVARVSARITGLWLWFTRNVFASCQPPFLQGVMSLPHACKEPSRLALYLVAVSFAAPSEKFLFCTLAAALLLCSGKPHEHAAYERKHQGRDGRPIPTNAGVQDQREQQATVV